MWWGLSIRSDLQDLFILLRQGLVDLPDVLVGQGLDIVLQLAVLILRDLAVLFLLLERVEPVAADVADMNAGLLGIFGRNLRQFPPPLLPQIADLHPDDTP